MSEWANANCDVIRVGAGSYGLPSLTVKSREGLTKTHLKQGPEWWVVVILVYKEGQRFWPEHKTINKWIG